MDSSARIDIHLTPEPLGDAPNISDLLLFPKHEVCRTMKYLDGSMSSSFSLRNAIGTPFTYVPLPSGDMVRLMVLNPGRSNRAMRCTLITTRLADASNYEAVSYVWGSSVKTGVIWCDGRKLKVTSNLYSALQTLRHRFEKRILWVDAICINQQDITERNSQVRLMRRIFQQASRVLAWLGPDDRRDNEAMELIQEIGSICVKKGYSDPQDLVDHQSFRTLAEPLYPSLTWESKKWWMWQSLGRFFELPFFCRTWIVQEVQASLKCLAICGAKEVDFSYIQAAALWYIRLPPTFDSGIFTDRGLSNAIYMRTLAAEDTTLLTRLEQTRGFFATDPRDKVFAFLRPGDTALVDYAKPTWQVFLDASVQMLQDDGFDCLSYVFHGMVPIKSLYQQFPTWVPTFSNSFIMPFCKLDSFVAGGNRDQLRYSNSGSKLKTKAIKIDRVSKAYPKLTWGSFESYNRRGREGNAWYALPTHLDWLWKEFVEDEKSIGHYRSGCSIKAAFALTITAGLRRWTSNQDFSSHEKAFVKFSEILFENALATFESRKNYTPMFSSAHTSLICECFQEDSFYEIKIQGGSEAGGDPDEKLRQQHLEDAQYFQRAVQSACNNRCLFVTESGYMGLGPHIISKECPDVWDKESGVYPELIIDETSSSFEIWVLPGAKVPFILQPQGNSYLLIGECFVHGLMEGQALNAKEYSGKFQDIELC